MIIPERRSSKVFSEDPKVDKKKEAEDILKKLAEDHPQYAEPDPDADAHRTLYLFLCSLIMWCSILGTIILTLSALTYLAIPDPLAYVTTQDGRLYSLETVVLKK
jgi:hypothetical protein